MPEVRYEDGELGPMLSNGLVTLSVHLNKGTFSVALADEEAPEVRDCAATVRLAGEPSFTTRGAGLEESGTKPVRDALGPGMSLLLVRETDEGEPEVELTLTLYEDARFAVAQVELDNRTASPLRVDSFEVADGARVDMGSPPEAWRFYKHGWQSWSPTLVVPCSGEDVSLQPPIIATATRPEDAPGRFVSELVGAAADPKLGIGVVAGFVSTGEQLSHVWLDRDSASLTAASYADGMTVAAGGRLASERLLLAPTRSPVEGLERYGEALGHEMGSVPSEQVASGWCSWYQYFTGVTEEQVLANLEFLSQHRREVPVEYVQIDDGWQAGIGDWLTPNEKFQHGMAWLAERVHERGFKAGLWLAPFIMTESSQLYREHPDWAVQYSEGRPYIVHLNWGQKCYALDLTRPDVIGWLETVFRTVCDEWGFDYVKIDFIYGGAVDGFRHDPGITRAQAYRHGLETIRRAVGERFILACGNPIGPTVGFADGARIGPDVAPYWLPVPEPLDPDRTGMSRPACLNSVRNILTRWWAHGRLWQNDPDCVLVRDSETALTEDEVRLLVTAIGLSGGMVLDSDDLTRLSRERLDLLSMLFPIYGRSARPLDLFEHDLPRLFRLDFGTHAVLGVFNGDDAETEIEVPLGEIETLVFELWGQQALGVCSGTVRVAVAPHGCRLLALWPALGRPQFAGSTLHLLQGAMEVAEEDWDGETLRIGLKPVARREGEVFVHTAGYGDATLEGSAGEAREVSPGLVAVRLAVDAEVDVRLRFGGPSPSPPGNNRAREQENKPSSR